MKPAFGYLRVSGRGQLDGDGEARQKENIQRCASLQGYQIIRWFFDGAVCGDIAAESRDKYEEMLGLCGDATTKTIIVECSDRLGRSLVVCEVACEEARSAGLTIISADSGMDLTNSDDPSRVAMRQIMGVMAQMNKNVMVKRLKVARDRIRAERGYCEGRAGFGNRGNPEDDFTLSLITTMKLARYSLRETAAELNRRKRPLPERGQCWHASTVSFLLKSADRVVRAPMRSNSKLLDSLAV